MPPRQLVPERQPVQQEPLLQIPPVQAVPVRFECEQLPFEQLSLVQALPSLQLLQGRPAFPHWVVEVPARHLLPVQQPVQQPLPSHVPVAPLTLQESPGTN